MASTEGSEGVMSREKSDLSYFPDRNTPGFSGPSTTN